MKSIHPATGVTIAVHDESTPEQAEAVVDDVHRAWLAWREVPVEERARRFGDLADVLDTRRDEAAVLMANEMGKPVEQGRAEISKCAWLCRHHAERGPSHLTDETVDVDGPRTYVSYRPLGVVLAVMPWNYPYWQVFRFAVPALLAGNAAVVKHADNVCGCALHIEALFREAGFPDDVLRTLQVAEPVVDRLLGHPRIAAATLTGSRSAGRAVAERAGSLLKKTVLELGGSDAYVVLADADLDAAADACVQSRLLNSGQSCIAAKRFVVERPVAGRFTEAVVDRMRDKRAGDPLDEDVDLGPQARRDLRDELDEQVRASIDAGARCLLGGRAPDGPGVFYPPTVLADVAPGMPAWDEELFGPVASVITIEDEAVAVANATRYGLGGAVFTGDVARGEALARDRLEAGCCVVNDFVRSDPRLPFGGVKESGYGRELGFHGLREFVNVKTVQVAREAP